MADSDPTTPLSEADPAAVAAFWARFLAATGRPDDTPQPEAWPFGDSVELADELIALVLGGIKRATAGSVAEFRAEGLAAPEVGDLEIVLDGAMRPRAVLRLTDVREGPLSSVDDAFAYDEGEGDRTRRFWLDAHTRFFARVLPTLGLVFDDDMPTYFQRFEVLYQ
ncbi:MAG: ASCH domain-containing protein [Actinomycetota bacterium]